MLQNIALPKCLNIKYEGNPEEIVGELMGEAYDAARTDLLEKRGRLQGVEERIQRLHPDEQVDTEEWLSEKISLLLYAYISHRTGILLLNDMEDRKEMSKPLLSGVLSELSGVLGKNTTQEIFRTLTYHADTAIEDRYGAQLQ